MLTETRGLRLFLQTPAMENPRGRIIAIEQGEGANFALVEVNAPVPCARCAAGKGCGAGLIGGTRESRRVEALVGHGVTIGEGDEVMIELKPENLLKASLIVYGLPLSTAIIASAFAYFAGFGDMAAALAALGGVALGLVVARARLRQSACLRRFTPTIIERIAIQRPPLGA